MIAQRIREIADYKGISISGLEKLIGASDGVLRRSIKNSTDIQSKWVSLISEIYPDINTVWLLTGKGEMLINSETNTMVAEPASVYALRSDRNHAHQRIPLYNVEATAGIVPLFENPNEYDTGEYLDIPNLPKCDGALFVTGDSMYPLLKSGDIIAYKQINDIINGIFWGEMYLVSILVDDEEYVTVKFLQKSPQGDDYIKLVSQNKHHQDKDVLITSIRKLALIKASVRINSMY